MGTDRSVSGRVLSEGFPVAEVKIKLLGSPEIYIDGSQIQFHRRKEMALLAFLSMESRTYSRDYLAELLYPDQDRRSALGSFRVNLYWLRSKLGPETVQTSSKTVSLAPDSVSTDVEELESLLTDKSDPENRFHRLKALYRGDFLSSFYLDSGIHFEEWQLENQDRLRSLYGAVLNNLAEQLLRENNRDTALEAFCELIKIDPLNEEAHRKIMFIHGEAGRFGLAIRQFQRCQEILLRELDTLPSGETVSLYQDYSRKENAETPGEWPDYGDSFTGRENEIDIVCRWIGQRHVKIVTIVGGPGIGKTRMAVEIAEKLKKNFPSGCFFVNLTVSTDGDDFPGLMARSLGIRDTARGNFGTQELVEQALSGRRALLLIDGYETLISSADRLSRLLEKCGDLKVLVTSREPLCIRGERLLHLSPLPQADVLKLFIERYKESGKEFNPADQQSAAAICERLDCVPLAVEMAVSRLDILSVSELHRRIGSFFRLLVRDQKARYPHHQTLRAAIDWSFRLLSEDQRKAFLFISLCPSGINLKFADSVLSDCASDPIDIIDSLVRKCLLIRSEFASESRFSMMESTRIFGREMLLSENLLIPFRERIITYYMELAEEADSFLHGSDQVWWIQYFEREWPNFKSVQNALLAEERYEEVLRISVDLRWFWYLSGRSETAVFYIGTALEKAGVSLKKDLKAWALLTLGWALFTSSRWPEARKAYQESLILFEELNDRDGLILALAHCGVSERWMGDESSGIKLSIDAVDMAKEEAAQSVKATAYIWAYATTDGRIISPGQKEGLEEILRFCRTKGDTWGISHALCGLGDLYREEGRFRESLGLYEQSLAGFRNLRDRWLEAWTLAGMGRALHGSFRRNDAVGLLSRAVVLFRDLGDQANSVYCLLLLGISLYQDYPTLSGEESPDYETGSRILAAFFALKDDMKNEDLGERLLSHISIAEMIEDSRNEFPAEWEAGRMFSFEQAVKTVLSINVENGGVYESD